MRRTAETEERTEDQRAREERGDSRMRGGMEGRGCGSGGEGRGCITRRLPHYAREA